MVRSGLSGEEMVELGDLLASSVRPGDPPSTWTEVLVDRMSDRDRRRVRVLQRRHGLPGWPLSSLITVQMEIARVGGAHRGDATA